LELKGRLEVSRGYLKTYPNKALAETPLKDTDTKRVYKSENHHQDWLMQFAIERGVQFVM